MLKFSRLSKYAWFVLAANIAVILWGAFVRATGSGAGCGSHWPLCNGVVIPRAQQIETVIEFTHRATSGIAFILLLILVIWIFKIYPKGHRLRFGSGMAMLFMVTEALVGAGLVLFEWVASDASLGRAISIIVHLVNTFLLIAYLTITAWWATGGRDIVIRVRDSSYGMILIGLLGTMVLGASGALAALGDTLFPVDTLAEGFRQDFSSTAHFLIRLRILHPTFAVLVGFYLIVITGIITSRKDDNWVQRFGRILIIAVLIQFSAGLLNVFLLAPVWMQLVHLLLADIIWIVSVLFLANVFAESDLSPVSSQQNALP
jgi:heme A synthase